MNQESIFEGKMDIEKLRTFEIAQNDCPVRKTLRPMGWTLVNDPADLSVAELAALVRSLDASARNMMQTYCSIIAPNCLVFNVISVENPELSVTVNASGPPHRMYLEVDITFECTEPI